MMKNHFGDTPYPPKKADFGRTKAEIGCFPQNDLRYSFGILHGLLSNKRIELGIPLIPPIKPILNGKWGNLVKSTLQTRVPENFR